MGNVGMASFRHHQPVILVLDALSAAMTTYDLEGRNCTSNVSLRAIGAMSCNVASAGWGCVDILVSTVEPVRGPEVTGPVAPVAASSEGTRFP